MNEIFFKKLTYSNLSLLEKWLEMPHVKPFWDKEIIWTKELIKEKYEPYIRGERKSLEAFIIHLNNRPIGYIQMYNAFDFPRDGFDPKDVWSDEMGSLAAIDFYIGDPDYIGKGLGTEILKVFLSDHVFPLFDACLVDPDKKNKIAISTYAKAGFSTINETDTTIVMIAKREEEINPIVIFGSSRKCGNTLAAVKSVLKDHPTPIIDLGELDISPYDYNYENRHDDFLSLAEKMVRHNPIILATPVYWYSMSAIMKTFIDRWSDLLDIRKDIGRRLANKELYIITSYGESIPRGFEDPFSQTCEYLDMKYCGCLYFYGGDDSELIKNNPLLSEKFSNQIYMQENQYAKSLLG